MKQFIKSILSIVTSVIFALAIVYANRVDSFLLSCLFYAIGMFPIAMSVSRFWDKIIITED